VQGFANCINKSLEQDPDFKGLLPIDGLSDALSKAVHDGILLFKLCNLASSHALDERAIATGKKLNTFSVLANIMLALTIANSLGLSIVNIGPPDICDGTPHLMLFFSSSAFGADEVDCSDRATRTLPAAERG
jgi:hypothetical protein